MPTTITGQNGSIFKQTTKIAPTGCGVQIIGRKVIGSRAFLTVKTFGAGRVTARGAGLSRVSRRFSSARTASLIVPLSRTGVRRHRPYRVRINVSFTPGRGARSSASTTVTFR